MIRQIPAADQLLAPVSVVAPDSTLLYVNAAAAHAIGQEPAWLIGRRMLELVHPDDRARIARQLRQVASGTPSGEFTTYRLRADPTRPWQVFESIADNLLDDPSIGGILVSSRDVTDQQAHERELYEAAYRDPLTGLPNRAKIYEQVEALLAEEVPLAVAFVGIDRFTLINDSLGHTTGDAVLQAVSARVRASVPATNVVGRFEGDRLIVLIVGAGDARRLLWRAVQRVSEPLDVDTDPQANAIVGAIITMADALGVEVVAEGVETATQAASLRSLGCTLAQGYLFGRPVEAD
jgi:diguanylate cyclase (GGDEF)-like protein/PAS domain S-box-containing protein